MPGFGPGVDRVVLAPVGPDKAPLGAADDALPPPEGLVATPLAL
jgi:hypothetical protein